MPADRYEETCALLEAAVRRVFPNAKPADGWGGPAWGALRPKGAPVANETGTYDPRRILIGVADRKQGPTIYFLDPGDYFILDKHRVALEAGGLKVMRGCLVHTKNAPFPAEAMETLMRDVRERDLWVSGRDAPPKKRAAKKPTKKVAKKAARGPVRRPAKRAAKAR